MTPSEAVDILNANRHRDWIGGSWFLEENDGEDPVVFSIDYEICFTWWEAIAIAEKYVRVLATAQPSPGMIQPPSPDK